MTTPLYNFGFSQEDELTEAAALGLPGGRVLSIASAGDMPLSLLALGAAKVVALDPAPSQLHLLRLKLAAVQCLEREEAIRFLGFLPATARERERSLALVLDRLPDATRRFWLEHRRAALRGAVWAGRFERFTRWMRLGLWPIFGRHLPGLMRASSLEEQRRHFARFLEHGLLRAAFRVAFHPSVFALRGIDPRSLRYKDERASLGSEYFDRFRALCTASPAATNPWLQLFSVGQVRSAACVPAYLTPDGFAAVRARSGDLTIVESDLLSYLRAVPDGQFDRAHLSNVVDWLGPNDFDELLHLLALRAARPARLVWRYIHLERPVPAALEGLLRIDAHLGTELEARDRFPFYRIVPATLTD